MEVSNQTNDITVQRKRGRPPRDTVGILDAAVTVFAREGFAAATVEMIAAEACASTATLYKLFTNKQGLFLAVLKETTSRSIAIHVNNRCEREHAFSAVINRLEAHALVSSDPKVRGVMRSWISEVRNHGGLSEAFAVNAGRELIMALTKQLVALQDLKLIEFASNEPAELMFAAQTMLGVVERFTLMRGLVLGDNTAPLFSSRGVAEKAVHAMMGIWGTPEGANAYKAIPKTCLTCQEADAPTVN